MLSYEERKAIENLKIEYEKLMKEDNILFPLYKSNAKRLIDIIEKQSKEIEELKEDSCCMTSCLRRDKEKLFLEDKIKAKIGERMQKNNNIIHNAKLKYGKDYVYYDDVQEAKEENCICKEVLQSLLEKE